MTPTNIRVNLQAPFPSLIKTASFIVVSKLKGVWTVAIDYTKLSKIANIADPTVKDVVAYDEVTKVYNRISLATFAATLNQYRIVTAAGDVNIAPGDTVILLNKLVGAATNIVLPASANRNGVPVVVKDLKGDGNANNITFVPALGETIDGFDAATAAANGTALIDINYGKKTLYPLQAGGWYV